MYYLAISFLFFLQEMDRLLRHTHSVCLCFAGARQNISQDWWFSLSGSLSPSLLSSPTASTETNDSMEMRGTVIFLFPDSNFYVDVSLKGAG